MKYFIASLLILLAWSTLNAQVVRSGLPLTYIQLSSYSSLNADVFSFTGNQAALAGQKNFSAGSYYERKFLLEELTSYTAALALPTSSGNFGLKTSYSGQSLFNESSVSLAYGRSVWKNIDVGIQFNYINLNASEYGHASAINFDAGVLIHLAERLNTGLHVSNPTSGKLGKLEDERLPSLYSAGIGYDVSDKFFIGTEIQKMEGLPVSITTGFLYRLDEKIITRVGISTPESNFYFGLGVLLKNLHLEATANVHPYLGVTPGLLLIYSKKQ